MPVITILGCRIFEDEVIHIIEKDPELKQIIVLENENNSGLLRKLQELQYPVAVMPLEKIEKIAERKDNSSFILVVDLLEFSLDGFPDKLREVVYEKLEEMQEYSDSILLMYGLCGNVLGSVEKDFEASGCPVFILKDKAGEIVDDCVGAVLGGRGNFLSKLKSEGAGTYFLTPVGAAYWKEILVASRVTPDPENVEMTKMVFDYSGYKNAAKINTGLCYEKEFETKVKEFADMYNFEIINMEGSPELIENCYFKVKKALQAKKDAE